jgi:hypothetical protein
MKIIPLTRGEFAIIDDEDFERVSKYKWSISSNAKGFHYAHAKVKINGKTTLIRMHRFITNAPKGVFVDHINGQTLDNQKHNLRFCTNQQNVFNSHKPITNTSGYKGVTLKKRHTTKRWCARITYNDKRIHLGYFATKEEAAYAYNEKAKELYGEFARLNPIDLNAENSPVVNG